MKKVVTLTLVLLVAALAIPAFADATPDGAALYKSKCALCHGANGEGKAAMKTTPFKKDMSEADIIKIIESGKGKMPAYKTKLSADEISQVAKHVKSLGK
jgi:mono/diheme cytochrome c family protein